MPRARLGDPGLQTAGTPPGEKLGAVGARLDPHGAAVPATPDWAAGEAELAALPVRAGAAAAAVAVKGRAAMLSALPALPRRPLPKAAPMLPPRGLSLLYRLSGRRLYALPDAAAPADRALAAAAREPDAREDGGWPSPALVRGSGSGRGRGVAAKPPPLLALAGRRAAAGVKLLAAPPITGPSPASSGVVGEAPGVLLGCSSVLHATPSEAY